MITTTTAKRVLAFPAMAAPFAVAGAGALACLFVGLVDPSRAQLLPPCPFKAITGGLDCPGCGATRAMHHLLHGHVGAAAGFNVMLLVALPYLLYSWLAWALPTVSNVRLPMVRLSAKAIYGIFAAVVLWWVVRNLPFAPFTGLHSDR